MSNSGLTAGGQNSETQTIFFTSVNPMNKDHVKELSQRHAWMKCCEIQMKSGMNPAFQVFVLLSVFLINVRTFEEAMRNSFACFADVIIFNWWFSLRFCC